MRFNQKKIAYSELQFSLNSGIEVILNRVISSPREESGNFSPLVSILHMGLNYQVILLFSPLLFFDIRVKVIVPALSALFSYSSWQGLCDIRPVSCTILSDPLK